MHRDVELAISSTALLIQKNRAVSIDPMMKRIKGMKTIANSTAALPVSLRMKRRIQMFFVT